MPSLSVSSMNSLSTWVFSYAGPWWCLQVCLALYLLLVSFETSACLKLLAKWPLLMSSLTNSWCLCCMASFFLACTASWRWLVNLETINYIFESFRYLLSMTKNFARFNARFSFKVFSALASALSLRPRIMLSALSLIIWFSLKPLIPCCISWWNSESTISYSMVLSIKSLGLLCTNFPFLGSSLKSLNSFERRPSWFASTSYVCTFSEKVW